VPARPVILQTEPLALRAETWLGERAEVVRATPSETAFEAAAPRAEALVVRTATRVDAALLHRLPRLRVVGRAGVGLETIALRACAERCVAVVHTPDANTQAVVEFVLREVLDALRPSARLAGAVAPAEWERLRAETVGARQMNECALGILGLGRIGSRVAEVACAIGCRVRYTDLRDIAPESRHGAEPVSIEELVGTSDILSVHVDGRAANRHLVGHPLLERMRPDALLVNTSRGLVVDASALARVLRGRPRMRALLDVHEPEPFPADYPLAGLPNARLTPHLASRTATAMEAMSWVVRDVWAVLEGRAPRWPAPQD
jgi:D-3-phosphoglycerate dehydrogenase